MNKEVLTTKYLIFDLEEATCKGGIAKICEFGYVVTNEKFEILNRGNFIIDPYIKWNDWDWVVVKTILTRKVREYEKSPKFDEYYDDIKDLILEADYIFGHSLDGDAKALNDECLRYNLNSIDFVFYDLRELYKKYSHKKSNVSVQNILKDFNIEGEQNEHDAEADAYNTMLGLKAILDNMKISLEELIELCPDAKNENNNYEVKSIVISRIAREEKRKEALSGGGDNTMKKGKPNRILFLHFVDNVLPEKEYEKKLLGLKISISLNYEEKHYKQMLNIVQILCNYGAKYTLKATEADIFVTYEAVKEDGTIKECSKLKHVIEENERGASIKIMSLIDFLKMIDLTEDELDNLPMVSFDCLYREDAVIKDKEIFEILNIKRDINHDEVQDDSNNSIGELYGDVLEKFKNKLDK